MDRAEVGLEGRVEALDTWIHELDGQLRALDVAGDGKTLKELRRALEAWAKHDPKLADRVTNRVDVLADRVATLAQTVNTTAAALAGKDGELAALRRDLESGYARMQAASTPAASVSAKEIAEIRAALAALSSERPSRRGNGKGDGRVDDLASRVDVLAGRVEMLATTAATTASGLAGRDGEIAMLRRQVEEGLAAVESKLGDFRTSVDPAQVQELRRVVKALSDETGGLKRDRQRLLDAVTSKFETVESKLDLVTSAAASAATGLAAREQEIDELRASTQDATRTVATTVADLRETLGAVSSHVSELQERETGADAAGRVGERLGEVVGMLDTLAERVDAVTAEVERASTGTTGQERELEKLRDAFADTRAQVDSTFVELRDSLAAVASQVAELEGRETGADAAGRVGERLGEVVGTLDTLGGRVDALATEVERTSAGSADREQELEKLTQGLEATRAHVDSVVADLREAIAAIPGTSPTESANSARLEELTRRIESFPEEIARLEGDITGRESQTSADRDRLEGAVSALAGSREEASRQLAQLSERLAGLELGHESAVAALSGRVEELARAAGADTGVDELGSRIESVERSVEAAVTDADRSRSERDAELQELREQIEALSEARESETSDLSAGLEKRVETLVERLEAVERDGVVVAAEIGRAAAFWASQIRELETRVAQVASAGDKPAPDRIETDNLVSDLMTRLQTLERERKETVPAEPQDGELRELVERLGARLAASERELAELATSRAVDAQLDDLADRIDSLERVGEVLPSSVPSDAGRYRVELRGLELRMDHAEAAARENREAVLLQLERLASRLDWRLQQESEPVAQPSEHEAPEEPLGPLGQVVHIHGEA